MRLFIAIDLPRSFKAELMRIQKEVKGISCGGRFVPQDNFHITLHFIGESDDIAGAAEAMHEAVRGIRPFTLHLGKYTSLEKGSHGRTAVMEVLGDLGELTAMHESLESALYDRGFPGNARSLCPISPLAAALSRTTSPPWSLRTASGPTPPLPCRP